MISVEGVLNDVLRREGGFVDDPADPGGPTKHGISLRYARGIGLDIDDDGDTDRDDIELVTPERAKDLYRLDFWLVPRINMLPSEIQPQLVDFAINSGPGRAVITLQNTLDYARSEASDVLTFKPLIPDGLIGKRTISASEMTVDIVGAGILNDSLVEARIMWLREIVRRDPVRGKFINGWVARAKEFESWAG